MVMMVMTMAIEAAVGATMTVEAMEAFAPLAHLNDFRSIRLYHRNGCCRRGLDLWPWCRDDEEGSSCRQ